MEKMLTTSQNRDERWATTRALGRPFLLVALPITLAGGLVMGMGINGWRQSPHEGNLAFILVGGVFMAIGLFYIGIMLRGLVKLWHGDFDSAVDLTIPIQPWQRRRDWALGEIQSETRSDFISALMAGIFGGLIATIAAFSLWPRRHSLEGLEWMALLFPLGALLLIGRSVFLGWRWLKFGEARLRLQTVPLRPGAMLVGVIHISRRIHPRSGFALRLACVKKTTIGTGKHRRVQEETLWRAEQRISGETLEAKSSGVQFVVTFQLPKSAPATRNEARKEILWRLRVSARMPGLNYVTDFVLPVFGSVH